MEYKRLKVSKDGQVGIMTINDPKNDNQMTQRVIAEILDALDKFEKDDDVRCVMLNSVGPNFSGGAGFDDITESIEGGADTTPFSDQGGDLVKRIDMYDKPTLVAAKGICFGGSTSIFSAFDIRIVGETFNIHDGDIYYGIVGSWGMCSQRLPRWIGRNRVYDYMFLNEGFTGRQAYEMGLASRVVPDDVLDEVGLSIAKKMATAAPVAVKWFKDCVREATWGTQKQAAAKEAEAADIVWQTEDAKLGLANVVKGKKTVFKGK